MDRHLFDANSVEYQTGVHTANFFEAVSAQVDKQYEAQNWDFVLGYNRFEGKSPSEMVNEYVNSGHSNPSSLDMLLQRVNDSYPDEEDRPDFVNEVIQELQGRTKENN